MINDELGDPVSLSAVDRGASEAELKGLALAAADTLMGQGLAQVANGATSLAETLRVVGDSV